MATDSIDPSLGDGAWGVMLAIYVAGLHTVPLNALKCFLIGR